jgi:hypothetical protein
VGGGGPANVSWKHCLAGRSIRRCAWPDVFSQDSIKLLQNYTASYPRLSWFWDSDISSHYTIIYCMSKMVSVAVNKALLTAIMR